MMPPKYVSQASETEAEEQNMRPSMVKKKQAWQRSSLAPYLNRKKDDAKSMKRQNSYISTTTATSNSTQTDLGDMLESQSYHSILKEESHDENENLLQNQKTLQSPPKTPGTVCADESFISSSSDDNDDDEVPGTSENAFLKRLEDSVDDHKLEAHSDDSDAGTEEAIFQKDNSASTNGKGSTSDYDTANSSISSKSTAEKADVSATEKGSSISSDTEKPPSPSDLMIQHSLTKDSGDISITFKTAPEKADISARSRELPSGVERTRDLLAENRSTDDSASSSISSESTAENVAVSTTEKGLPKSSNPELVAESIPTNNSSNNSIRPSTTTEKAVNHTTEPENIVAPAQTPQLYEELRSIGDRPSHILEKYIFGSLAMSLTTFVTMGSVTRNTAGAEVEREEADVQTLPSLSDSDQSKNGSIMNTSQNTNSKDFVIPVTNLNDDVEVTTFANEDVESTPVASQERNGSVSPTSERNIRQLQYLTPNSELENREILSRSPSNDVFKIPVPNMQDEDEEAQLVISPGSLTTEKLKDASESPTALTSSELAGGSDSGNGSDGPDESKEVTLESEAARTKKSLKEEGPASRTKSLRMICYVVAFAALIAVTLPFFMSTTVSASAAIETPSPSSSMAPSSTPSLSQAPSDAPSTNPSLYPTISALPTIAPSVRPTLSIHPSMVPSVSGVPSLEPSIAPTESMEPSDDPSAVPSTSPSSNPSESPSLRPTESMVPSSLPSKVPSQSPSNRPTQHPTITFQPSRRPTRSPTREPTDEPTRNPTRPPITPPPPADLASAFKIRLYWNESYFWQETTEEAFWCMECVKCAEYGNLDGFDHGCVSHGTGNENRCSAGDSVWIRDCRDRGNRFNIQGSGENGFMVRIATTDLCIERIKDIHPLLFVQPCDQGSPWQRFLPWNDYNKFELRPVGYRGQSEEMSECVSQLHHPKQGELLALHNCALSRQYETLYWQKY